MKHHGLAWLCACLFILLYSCNQKPQDADDTLSLALSNPDTILQHFNEGRLPDHQGELLSGEVQMQASGDSMLYIHLDSPSEEDFILYILQVDSAYSLSSTTWEYGEVLFLHENLFVTNTLDETDYWFKLTSALAPDSVQQTEVDATFEGFGLIRTVYARESSGITWSDPSTFTVRCRCRRDDLGDDDCDGGGRNATSCSVSNNGQSCNVTCENGLDYPCCELDATD